MRKRPGKLANIVVLLLYSAVFFGGMEPVACAEEITIRMEEPLVLAPGSLESREQAELERRYRYEFRQKDIILDQPVATPFSEGPAITPISPAAMTEQERLYRYFGIASVLRESGRLEEAIEILKYIASKRPDDKYVKGYLAEVKAELQQKKAEWKKTTRKDAELLRKIRLKELITDGTNYYKQKRYDDSFLKFNDALALDPDNAIAHRYIDKLKKHYLKEVRVEGIVRGWEKGRTGEDWKTADLAAYKPLGKGVSSKMARASIELLDRTEKKDAEFSSKMKRASERMLNREEVEGVMREKKSAALMQQAELDIKIQEIISRGRARERRERSYTLGPGDQVQVSVQDHPELSGATGVGPSGDVLLPLVNEPVMAQGLTVSELAGKIKEVLKRYVKDPVVYVGVTAYKSKVFYVIDEDGSTPYNITRANFTLRDALFLSDWGSNRALGRVLVIKPDKLHPIIKKIDAFDLVYRGNLSRNIRIENGDVIYVPMTAASKITQTISDTLSPVQAVRDLRDEWLTQRWNLKDGWYNLPRIPRRSTHQADMNAGAGSID